jgi:signal transduction histidine kinase
LPAKAARLERGSSSNARLADAREEERRRLARELHDGPAQSLAAALFGVDLAIGAMERTPAAAREEILHARELLRDALDDLRGLMSGLRPRLLEERGLVVALRSLAGVTPLRGPAVEIATRGIDPGERLPAEVELALYRIAQEAMSNARRHGAATRVVVTLELGRGQVTLAIADDGHGFPPQEIRPRGDRGEGLPGMRERAALLGSELAIESAPGRGTRIALSVAVPDNVAGLMEGEP